MSSRAAFVKSAAVTRGIGVPPMNESDHGRDGHATQVFLDPQKPVGIRQGASLPHWTQDGATYAVTFRLADSLPVTVLQSWNSERNQILESALVDGREPSDEENRRLAELFSEKVESYLDAGHGGCWMRDPRIANLVAEALRHFDCERYLLHAWCVMPNHVHAVVQPAPGHTLVKILHSWKSFTAHKAVEILGISGEFWQPESFDHLIRDESDFQNQRAYVLENPSKSRLKNWTWSGARGIGVQPMNENDHGRDGHATCLACLLFCLLASLACAADPDVRTGESAAAVARPLANLFQHSPSDDFRNAVAQLPDLRVYEGLPDPKTEKALYEKEKLRGDVTSFGGWNFYSKPLDLTESETASLRELFQPGNPFASGGDACEKFHPDYALVWESGEYLALIGLGCQEIHAVGPSIVIHRYIPPEIYAKFERILGKYTVNRPQPGP